MDGLRLNIGRIENINSVGDTKMEESKIEENKVGRPGLYESRVAPRLEEIREWARAGASHKEMASALNIGYSTFSKYVKGIEELKEMLSEAQMSGVPEVKLALLKRALGYEYQEKKMSQRKDDDGVVREYMEITTKHVAPDVSAIAMYLRNNGDGWKDKDELSYKFKKMEIDLKKKMVELGEWK